MIESIEKLRKWVKSLYTPNSGELKVEGLDIADEIEAEIAERYMELPVDADGVPIHVGDRLTNINKPSDEYTVAGVNGEKLFVYGGHAFICASQCRHVRPRTIEDVLREFAEKCAEGSLVCEEADVRKYADEIRELMEVRDD